MLLNFGISHSFILKEVNPEKHKAAEETFNQKLKSKNCNQNWLTLILD